MKKQKYYNIRTRSSDGIIHDSSKEAARWEKLCLLQKAGKISCLQRQVKYELIPAQYETYERYSKKGQRLKDEKRCIERGIDYVADFVYYDKELKKTVVEDVKGYKEGAAYRIFSTKRKLMLWVHGIRVKEV
jgi:hypothetical protein